MKMRIKFSEVSSSNYLAFRRKELSQEKIDEILIWCTESEIDAEFYSFHNEERTGLSQTGSKTWTVTTYGIFTIDPEYMLLFILKWGAVLHKKQKELT